LWVNIETQKSIQQLPAQALENRLSSGMTLHWTGIENSSVVIFQLIFSKNIFKKQRSKVVQRSSIITRKCQLGATKI
jgi:hypothetical protein